MTPSDPSLVSLADLSAADVQLHPVDAATIVRELLLQVSRGELPGVPSAHVIRLGSHGRVSVEGPVAAGGRGVSRAAQLLDALLPGFDAPPERRVPGALRLVIARALGVLDLPPYPSIESFAEALARFAAPEPDALITDLVTGFATARAQGIGTTPAEPDAAPVVEKAAVRRLDAAMRQEPAAAEQPVESESSLALTISDIRRARRATGLTLADIAERSRIPAWLLRELEWGYVRNWPSGHYGRTQLVRYARASGLDDELVVRTVWPMLDAARDHGAPIVPAVQPVDPIPAHPVIDGVVEEEPAGEPLYHSTAIAMPAPAADRPGRSRKSRILAALAVPALLAIGLAPALWQRATDEARVQEPQTVAAREASEPIALQPEQSAAIPTAAQPASTLAGSPTSPPPPAARGGTQVPVSLRETEPIEAEPFAADPATERVLADGAVYSPTFASAGSAIFYHADAGDESALMRADTDGQGEILRLTSVVDDNARNFHARPSPDGDRIAFDSDREGERAVYIADADGRNVRRVSGPGFAAIPSWSPDGRTLAYVRAEPDRPRVWNLWIKNLDSGDERRITSFRVGQPWGGSWFPDGRRIAFSHETRLIVHDLETGRERVFPSPIKGRLVRTPAVSPDGSLIVFQVYRDGTWLLDAEDGSMRKVLSDPTAEEYTWAPDGQRVAYHSRRSGTWGVWVMAGRNPKTLKP